MEKLSRLALILAVSLLMPLRAHAESAGSSYADPTSLTDLNAINKAGSADLPDLLGPVSGALGPNASFNDIAKKNAEQNAEINRTLGLNKDTADQEKKLQHWRDENDKLDKAKASIVQFNTQSLKKQNDDLAQAQNFLRSLNPYEGVSGLSPIQGPQEKACQYGNTNMGQITQMVQLMGSRPIQDFQANALSYYGKEAKLKKAKYLQHLNDLMSTYLNQANQGDDDAFSANESQDQTKGLTPAQLNQKLKRDNAVARANALAKKKQLPGLVFKFMFDLKSLNDNQDQVAQKAVDLANQLENYRNMAYQQASTAVNQLATNCNSKSSSVGWHNERSQSTDLGRAYNAIVQYHRGNSSYAEGNFLPQIQQIESQIDCASASQTAKNNLSNALGAGSGLAQAIGQIRNSRNPGELVRYVQGTLQMMKSQLSNLSSIGQLSQACDSWAKLGDQAKKYAQGLQPMIQQDQQAQAQEFGQQQQSLNQYYQMMPWMMSSMPNGMDPPMPIGH